MAASSRSTKAIPGTRQLAALIATLALALVLVAGIGAVAMSNRTAPTTAHPIVSTQHLGGGANGLERQR